MYVFGGKDDDNFKLNDLWKLDLQTYTWTELHSTDGFKPLERSGHACDVFEHYMIVFGGIFEITKELNDFYLFDFRKSRWFTLFEESNSPTRAGKDASPSFTYEDSHSPIMHHAISTSPTKKKSTKSPLGRNRQGSPPQNPKTPMKKCGTGVG